MSMQFARFLFVVSLIVFAVNAGAATSEQLIPKPSEWLVNGRKIGPQELQQMVQSGRLIHDTRNNIVCVKNDNGSCKWTWPNGTALTAQELIQTGQSPMGRSYGLGDSLKVLEKEQLNPKPAPQMNPIGSPQIMQPLNPGMTPAFGSTAPVTDQILFSNWNSRDVTSGGRSPMIVFNRPVKITSIATRHKYHRLGGGMRPQWLKIGLLDQNGRMLGPWTTVCQQVNCEMWEARPNQYLPPGRYFVVDPEQATWSQNVESRGEGQVTIRGLVSP